MKNSNKKEQIVAIIGIVSAILWGIPLFYHFIFSVFKVNGLEWITFLLLGINIIGGWGAVFWGGIGILNKKEWGRKVSLYGYIIPQFFVYYVWFASWLSLFHFLTKVIMIIWLIKIKGAKK